VSQLIFAHVDVRPDDLPAVGAHGVDPVVAHVFGDDLVVVHDSRVDLLAVHVHLSATRYVWKADR